MIETEGIPTSQDVTISAESARNAGNEVQTARSSMFDALGLYVDADPKRLGQYGVTSSTEGIYSAQYFPPNEGNVSRVAVVVGTTSGDFAATAEQPGNIIASMTRRGGTKFDEDPIFQRVAVDNDDPSKIIVEDATFHDFQTLLQERIAAQLEKAEEINNQATTLNPNT